MNKKDKAALLVATMLSLTGMTMDQLIESAKTDELILPPLSKKENEKNDNNEKV